MFSHTVTFLLLFLQSSLPTSAHRSASGNLNVTAAVTSSVLVTFDSDGKPIVVVANAPADADAIVLASMQFEKAKMTHDQKTLKASASTNKTKGTKHAYH
jgi:hypothetical protein